jgi:hypothetical protein
VSPEQFLRGDGCLTPADLEAILEGRLPGARAHIDTCPACEHELASMREFLAASAGAAADRDLAWIEARLRPAATPAPASRRWLAWLPVAPLPRFAFACAAALLVIASGLQLRHMAGPSLDDSRSLTVRSAQIRLLAPAGDLEMAPAEFRWEPLPHSATYEVALTEVDGATVWTGRTNQSKLNSPESVQQQMLPRKTLLWRVRALDEQGVVIAESSIERIRLLPAGKQ